MLDFITSGGWMMWVIVLASVVAMAISVERSWMLRASRVIPPTLLAQVMEQVRSGRMDGQRLAEIRNGSPLGYLFATGLLNSKHGREIMKNSMAESAGAVLVSLEKYLSLLGTIAALAPLMGLLGTVLGIIESFQALANAGNIHNTGIAAGVSQALVSTSGGIMVAIPALFMHRTLTRRIEVLTQLMEQECFKLADLIHGEKQLQTEKSVSSARADAARAEATGARRK